jgi:hypothetical protein
VLKHCAKSFYVDLKSGFSATGMATKRQGATLETVRTGYDRYSCVIFADIASSVSYQLIKDLKNAQVFVKPVSKEKVGLPISEFLLSFPP